MVDASNARGQSPRRAGRVAEYAVRAVPIPSISRNPLLHRPDPPITSTIRQARQGPRISGVARATDRDRGMHSTRERPAGRTALRADETAPPAPAGRRASVARFTGGHAIAALVVCTLAAFLPVRDNGFVSYDDRRNFLE